MLTKWTIQAEFEGVISVFWVGAAMGATRGGSERQSPQKQINYLFISVVVSATKSIFTAKWFSA